MMNTILNLGLNDQTCRDSSLRPAIPASLRLLPPLHQMFGEVALGVEMEHFDEA